MSDAWVEVPKTPDMIALEDEHGLDIRDIILDGVRAHRREQDAALILEITPSLLSRWIRLLGIYPQILEIRDEKLKQPISA